MSGRGLRDDRGLCEIRWIDTRAAADVALAQARERARKQRSRLRGLARKARRAGDVAKAEALLARPARVYPPPPALTPAARRYARNKRRDARQRTARLVARLNGARP